MLGHRGIALPLVLIVGLALSSLTLAILALAAFEPTIARNLVDTAQARFAAEAGIEWAFDLMATTKDWNTRLVGADPTNGVLLTPVPRPIGNLSAAHGTFTVRLRNDTLAGDPAVTGVTPIDASPTDDQNKVVIVTSTGNVGSATRTIRVAMKRLTFPPGLFPAALAFPGNEAETTFNGNSFEVDGRGWRTNGTLDAGCSEVLGISVSSVLPASDPGANEAAVEASLTAIQKDNVKGKKQNPAGPGEGDNTIAPNPVLTPTFVQNFINKAKNAADIVLDSRQPNGLSFTNIGSTCASDVNSNTCWGTAEHPKIIYIRGEPDPSSMFSALQLSGNTEGHGILIVEDGDLRITGNFLWHGPIIVTGQWVGIGFLGGGNQVIYGAVISNETSVDPGFREGVMAGNAKIRYSCEALNETLTARKLTSITNWKDLAPGE